MLEATELIILVIRAVLVRIQGLLIDFLLDLVMP